jgi:hypothetical protein
MGGTVSGRRLGYFGTGNRLAFETVAAASSRVIVMTRGSGCEAGIIPEGSGSSGPLASASSTLAFLLASARVRGVCPDELGECHARLLQDDRRQRCCIPALQRHLPRSVFVAAVPVTELQTLQTTRWAGHKPQEHDNQARLQVDHGPGRRRQACGPSCTSMRSSTSHL